ncbi:hypothetical protein B0H14DRAFT_2558167 [Mycena olivaceomarginata]|nr:hypothetical protein B0H14DRAFT_2558167 [Mycena olivaceomarginata]
MRGEYAQARGVARRECKRKLGQAAAACWRGDSNSSATAAAPASEAAQHGCRGWWNTAIGSHGAITMQAHPTSTGPSAAKRWRCRSGDIAWCMQAAELQAEKAASPESLCGRHGENPNIM